MSYRQPEQPTCCPACGDPSCNGSWCVYLESKRRREREEEERRDAERWRRGVRDEQGYY